MKYSLFLLKLYFLHPVLSQDALYYSPVSVGSNFSSQNRLSISATLLILLLSLPWFHVGDDHRNISFILRMIPNDATIATTSI